MNWIENPDKRTQAELQSGTFINTFPTKNIRIPVDKEAVLRNGIVAPEDADLIVDEIVLHVKEDLLYKNRLMMLSTTYWIDLSTSTYKNAFRQKKSI